MTAKLLMDIDIYDDILVYELWRTIEIYYLICYPVN